MLVFPIYIVSDEKSIPYFPLIIYSHVIFYTLRIVDVNEWWLNLLYFLLMLQFFVWHFLWGLWVWVAIISILTQYAFCVCFLNDLYCVHFCQGLQLHAILLDFHLIDINYYHFQRYFASWVLLTNMHSCVLIPTCLSSRIL